MANPKKPARGARETAARSVARGGVGSVPLREHAAAALGAYFERLNGYRPSGLYELVIREVEEPLFRAVLRHTAGNQCRAAEILGINRGTLRRKLEDYGIVE